MNIPKITVLAFGGMAVLAGCMSLEERLSSSDIEVRNEAEYELMAKVNGAPKSERLAAIRRVKNPEHLEYIATYADESKIDDGLVAVDNIEDASVLIRVAKKARSMDVRKAASSKIQDEKILCDIACGKYGYKGAAGDTFCMDALSRIKDKTFISKVAEEGKSDATAKSAFQRLDQDEKLRIALMGVRQEYLRDVISAGKIDEKVMNVTFSKGDSETRILFVTACSDEGLLLKSVESFGAKMSPNECAALANKPSMPKLKAHVADIADRKLADEVEKLIKANNWNYGVESAVVEKIKAEFSKIQRKEIKLQIVKQNFQVFDERQLCHLSNALVNCLTADEAREYAQTLRMDDKLPFINSLSDSSFANLIMMESFDAYFDEAICERIKHQNNIDIDAVVGKKVDFKGYRIYGFIKNNETADLVWKRALLNDGYTRFAVPSLLHVWNLLTPEQKAVYRKIAADASVKVRNQKPAFCGLYIGMPARDSIAMLSVVDKIDMDSAVGVTNGKTLEVFKIMLNRADRYKLFPKEDKEFWPAFLKEFMPRDANKKESATEIVGGALDAAFGNYERERNKELDEMCYVLKSMKYGVRVSFGLESGTLIIEEYDGR